jgi:hypothetical protein
MKHQRKQKYSLKLMTDAEFDKEIRKFNKFLLDVKTYHKILDEEKNKRLTAHPKGDKGN